MNAADDYEPKREQWQRLWRSFSSSLREKRFADALERQEAVLELKTCDACESERSATEKSRSKVARSSVRRWLKQYEKWGFDGLLDWRCPPSPLEMPEVVKNTICTLRRADPNMSVEVIVAHVSKYHQFDTSDSVVKRVLRQAGLARRSGPVGGKGTSSGKRLELGGMKLVEAALVETGYLRGMATVVHEQLSEIPEPQQPTEVDTSHRDEIGRFVPSYNERYEKQPGDVIGPGFASIEHKRKDLDPGRLHATFASLEVIERKMYALMTCHILGGGRWDGLRVARGALLEEVCGFAYMPATLDLFTRELKYVGVSSTLWELHAHTWLAQTQAWGDKRDAVVLYIDETNKPVWTDLFSQSSKVSSVGRVMPSLETVSFHSGYGVPLWMVTHSGRMPLVNAVPTMLDRFSKLNEGAEIGRIVVIDAEGNSVPFLKGLEQGKSPRGWVSRFKPSMLKGKRIFNRTNFRPYRDGDRIRVGEVDLNDPEVKGGKFRMRVVEIERRTKKEITYIGASKLLQERDWNAEALGDLYFARWPKQEANFRALNQALQFKQVHGYGKQLVNNVTVVTRLDELEQSIARNEEQVAQSTEQYQQNAQALHEQQKQMRRAQRRQETASRQLQKRLDDGQTVTPQIQLLAAEQTELTQQLSKHRTAIKRLDAKTTSLDLQLARQQQQLDQHLSEREQLEPRRRIFKHDVELDSIFSVLKVGLVMAITFVLKEYFVGTRMEALTFLERIATLPARLKVLPRLEVLTFEYNQRDPETMALLFKHCDAINARGLTMRSGRKLQLRIEPAPPTTRPPPQRRTTTADRIVPR